LETRKDRKMEEISVSRTERNGGMDVILEEWKECEDYEM
jgi:hypothetical protein